MVEWLVDDIKMIAKKVDYKTAWEGIILNGHFVQDNFEYINLGNLL